MATKPDDDDKGEAYLGPQGSPDWDFERFLSSLHGDRFDLQSSQQDFIDRLSQKGNKDVKKFDPAELIEDAKRALGKGELKIAENYFVKAIRTSILDNSNKKSPEPYFYLAEILEKKAEELELLQKQRYLLQAAALYNFVRNYLESRDTDVELSKELSNLVPGKLLNIEDNMIKCEGSPLQSRFDAERKKKELKNLRNEVKELLESMECISSSCSQGGLDGCEMQQKFKDQIEGVKKLSDTVSERMKQFFASIIDKCLALLGTPCCDYEVIVFGSLARNEATPYSDFEWAILTSSEEEKCKVFFRNLTNLVHLQVINLGETILPSMNIEAINGEWFYDDVTPKGVSFDGLLPQACKIPLGNMKDFELIHTPEKMAEFQSYEWYEKNWSLADTLKTFSPLQSKKSLLVEAYRNEIDKILSNPCDSESCQHDASSDAWPTRGFCRSMQVLDKDLSIYGDVMAGNNDLDEGKFYDVKKEIYRLPDRLITALAKCCEVKSAGIFAVLDELYEKEVISPEARLNLASASAIAIKLRLSTYLKAGKQDEQLSIISNEKPGQKVPVYHMPTDEELFHFFFVAIPLYDELRQFKKSGGNIPSSFAKCSFFNDSDITMGHIYCRLFKYEKAIECYERTARENPDNLSAEIRRIRLVLFATHNTQESHNIRENLDNLLGKIVKNFSQLDTIDDETRLEFTLLMNRIDIEERLQLIEGLVFASDIYRSSKYLKVALKILRLFMNPSTLSVLESSPKDVDALIYVVIAYLLTSDIFIRSVVQQHAVDVVLCAWPIVIDEKGQSTKSIVSLNSFGEFLFNQGKLDKAYRCFQRSLKLQHLLFGNRPNVKMMTSLHFLGIIAAKLDMLEESKFHLEFLVQRFESFGGIKSKLIIKETYLQLFHMSITADESLHYVENGLKVTTGSKNERELLLNCELYRALAIALHSQQSPERAWEAVLKAQACLKDCTDTETRGKMIHIVGSTFHKIKKSKEGIKLLEIELQKFTLQSHFTEKVSCLKALGELCLVQGLAAEAKKYYSQAIVIQEENETYVFHNLECRIRILEAAVKENRVSDEKAVLDKALSSVMKLPASNEKCNFLLKIGKLCQSKSIGKIDNARRCCVEAFSSATELPASYEKCSFLQYIGRFCESIPDIVLARQCYDDALKTYKEQSNIVKKPPIAKICLEMKLGELTKKMISTSFPPRIHYDRAAVILRKHVATGLVNPITVLMFLGLARVYVPRDEAIQLLLECLKVSETMYREDKSNEMVTATLQELSRAYYLLGDMENSMKYRERQIEKELELYSDNPFLECIVNTLSNWALTSFHVPTSKDSIERVRDSFLSSLNDKASLLDSTATRTIAAKCFTFIAVLFYTSSEKAESLSEKASQLFGEIQESTERDPCREVCDLMKTILSSEKILPSHRTELYIYISNIAGPYPDSESAEDDRCRDAGDEELIKEEVNKQAPNPEEQSTLLSQPIVLSQLDALEHYKRKGEFRLAAEIHAFLQPQQLNFYKNSPFDGEEKLISDAIEAKKKNQPSKAVRLLDLALQCRRTQKVLKLRGECFLSMGHFRSAAIDFGKAQKFYSPQTIDNREELLEYSEVLIGLVKSEILCNNIKAAGLVCEKGIELLTNHKPKETINQQAAKLFYLQLRCMNILSERGMGKEFEIPISLLAFRTVRQLAEENYSPRTVFEMKFMFETTFPTFSQKKKVENTSQEMKRIIKFADLMSNCKVSADFVGNVSSPKLRNAEPKFLIEVGINCSLKARLLFLSGDTEQSINWLHKSLAAFFSAPLPDSMLYFEEFLPLLETITAIKSSAPDRSRSPFQQAVDLFKTTLTNQNKSLNYVNQFLTALILIHKSLGQAQEAIVVAETGLEINDFMCDNSDSDKLNNRCRMLLHLAQLHQQNSSNPAFNAEEERDHAEYYYLINRGRENYLSNRGPKEDMVLCKDLSYANFLCQRKRFEEAVAVLEDMRTLDQLLWNKYVYVDYFSCAFYGAGVEKSVEIDGELFTTVGDVLYNLLVRAYVGMGKRKEAIAMCEILTDVNLVDVHEASFGKRPSSKPRLVEDCHRGLLSLMNEADRHQFENCDFPLSSENLVKLYYMFAEYEMAAKYLSNDVQSPEMLEMKISCLRLAGNELVDSNRGNESLSFFQQFLEMLQVKEGFLDKSLHDQCEILQTYHFANQYYLFRSLGGMHAERENIDAAIQYYERCVELDEDFTCGQDIVPTLSGLYQTKALTDEDSRTVYMDLAWKVFQKLFRKTVELTTLVEMSFASLLTRLDRCEEAVDHFYKVIERADNKSLVTLGKVDKPIVDDDLRLEIEALGGSVNIPIKVLAAYKLISTLMKLNQRGKALKVAYFLESVVKKYLPTLPVKKLVSHSMAGYAYKIIGEKEKAAEIFTSVLENNPGHPPLTKARESCGDLKKGDHHDRRCPDVVDQCESAPVICGNEGCGMIVNESEKENHEKNFCKFRVAEDEAPKASQNEIEASKKIQGNNRETEDIQVEIQSKQLEATTPDVKVDEMEISKARSLAVQFMSENPCCVRAIPYKSKDAKSLTMWLYMDTNGKGIPKEIHDAAEKMFKNYEFVDLLRRPLNKIVTHLPSTEKQKAKELADLTTTIEKNLHLFENRMNVTAVQASYKVTAATEKNIPCVTVYVLGKGKIPAGETDIKEMKEENSDIFNQTEFDVAEGYYKLTTGSSLEGYTWPLEAGVGIGVEGVRGAGTLGGFLEDEEKNIYILSNQHVLHPTDAAGNVIIQPSECDHKAMLKEAEESIKECTDKINNPVLKALQPEEIEKINTGCRSFFIKRMEEKKEQQEKKLTEVKREEPRQIGTYVYGFKENFVVDGHEVYVDAAIATLDKGEFYNMKYNQTNRCSLYGFETNKYWKTGEYKPPNGDIIDFINFRKRIRNEDSELRFMKIGRTTGFTDEGFVDLPNEEMFLKYTHSEDISRLLHVEFLLCRNCNLSADSEFNPDPDKNQNKSNLCKICGTDLKNPSQVKSVWARNCFVLRKREECFSKEGDSGALVFDKDGLAWGLVFGVFRNLSLDFTFSLISPLRVVLDALKQKSGKELKLWCARDEATDEMSMSE